MLMIFRYIFLIIQIYTLCGILSCNVTRSGWATFDGVVPWFDLRPSYTYSQDLSVSDCLIYCQGGASQDEGAGIAASACIHTASNGFGYGTGARIGFIPTSSTQSTSLRIPVDARYDIQLCTFHSGPLGFTVLTSFSYTHRLTLNGYGQNSLIVPASVSSCFDKCSAMPECGGVKINLFMITAAITQCRVKFPDMH
jgi:hypothetical protein